MHFTEKINALYTMEMKVIDLKKEILDENSIFLQENRKYDNGTVVDVFYSHNNVYVNQGIIEGCTNFLMLDLLSLKRFDEKELKNIFYGIKALKKDQSASKNFLFEHPHFIPDFISHLSDYYFKPRL